MDGYTDYLHVREIQQDRIKEAGRLNRSRGRSGISRRLIALLGSVSHIFHHHQA